MLGQFFNRSALAVPPRDEIPMESLVHLMFLQWELRPNIDVKCDDHPFLRLIDALWKTTKIHTSSVTSGVTASSIPSKKGLPACSHEQEPEVTYSKPDVVASRRQPMRAAKAAMQKKRAS
jgi:hypothetical protein